MTKKEETSKDKEFEKLQKQCQEYLNGWKRARADYENLKKEVAKEKEAFIRFANLNLFTNLIPVYGNLKISFKHLPEELKDSEWVKGLEQIKKQFQEVLTKSGLEEIKVKEGDEFNPEIHEAVKHPDEALIPPDSTDENGQGDGGGSEKEISEKVVRVISDGCKLYGKVIVPAKVIVN